MTALNTVETRYLIAEMESDGHTPVSFKCSDGEVYFVKYLSGKSYDKREITCLVFEMLCTAILQELKIPVPDQSLVKISGESLDSKRLKVNKRTLKPGVIGWGSKEIKYSDIVSEFACIQSRDDFNRYLNPEDLIRIAIFDLWIDNSDRHEKNYNLLTVKHGSQIQIIPIDHAFAFGGLNGMHIFNETHLPDSHNKLITSPYFHSFMAFISVKERIKIAKSFLTLLTNFDIIQLADEVFKNIPPTWEIDFQLKKRIVAFLQSESRMNEIKKICTLQMHKNFRRTKQ